MKAIYINAIDKTVTEIEIEKGINPIYSKLECDIFECPMQRENNDFLYVDEEGMLKPERNFGFIFGEYPQQPLFGHGLLIGTDEFGNSIDCESKTEDVKKIIGFFNNL